MLILTIFLALAEALPQLHSTLPFHRKPLTTRATPRLTSHCYHLGLLQVSLHLNACSHGLAPIS